MGHSCDCHTSQPKPPLDELVEFPCDYIFKAFGPNEESFIAAVRDTISKTVVISADALRTRSSSKGEYQCVTAVVRLHHVDQLQSIYADLQQLPTLKYLL